MRYRPSNKGGFPGARPLPNNDPKKLRFVPVGNQSKDILARFPPKLMPLFDPHRFKILYGGRGSGKSWSVARALLLIGYQTPIRVLCARETMTSLSQSVHQLLSDQIHALGLQGYYDITNNTIRGFNGTEFRFAGMRSNVSQIKSFEGITVAWIEEAQNVSTMSWDTLIPTLRGEGFIPGTDSEIWVTFNPDLETDETYQRFVIDPPHNAWVQPMNYVDNPWFPEALQREMAALKVKDYDKYLNIYMGECRQFTDGAVYLRELKEAAFKSEEYPDSRICKLAYDSAHPVHAFLDLGWADATAIWLVQKIGFRVHALRYIEGQRRTLDSYLKQLEQLPYKIDTYHLPHDARARNLGTGKSIEELLRARGKTVQITPNISVVDGINQVRTLFPNVLFHRDHCADGLHALRHYRFEIIENGRGGFKDQPVHDRFSHGSDAWRYVCVGLRAPKKKPDASKYRNQHIRYGNLHNGDGWMSL